MKSPGFRRRVAVVVLLGDVGCEGPQTAFRPDEGPERDVATRVQIVDHDLDRLDHLVLSTDRGVGEQTDEFGHGRVEVAFLVDEDGGVVGGLDGSDAVVHAFPFLGNRMDRNRTFGNTN